MQYFKILPAAAGVIALTATIAFARDQREAEEGYSMRITVAASDVARSSYNASASLLPETGGEKPEHCYLVEVARQNTKNLLTIDAGTGRILERREIPV